MRALFRAIRSFLIVVALVGVNGFLMNALVGLPYSGFAWKVLALAYDSPSLTDTDNDGIPDANEPTGHNGFADPSGCFYEIGSGRIVPGGSVDAVVSPPLVISDNGNSDGCYQYTTQQNFGSDWELSVTVPNGCVLAQGCMPPFGCPASGTCSPSTNFNPNTQAPVFLGALVDPNDPNFLESGTCSPYFLDITLDANEIGVFANNIALVCDFHRTAPAAGGGGIAALGAVLLGLGVWAMRREKLGADR